MARNGIFTKGKKHEDSFIKGFFSIFNSIKVISENKGLIKYFIVPFLLNLFILTSIFYFSYTSIKPWFDGFLTGSTWYINILKHITGPLLLIILFIITILIYSIFGSIITSPFNDFLSLKVEMALTGINFDEKFSISVFINDMIRVTANILRLLVLVIIINIGILFINLIPIIGSIIYPFISFLVTAFFLGFQFFDFPLERRRYVFKEKLLIILKFKFQTMGLGTGFFLISFIPLVGFLGLNMATIGGTTLFIDNIKPVLNKKNNNN